MSTTSLMTFAEFEQLPEMPGKQELVDGELIILPPPELSHVEMGKLIFLLLLKSFSVTRVWPGHTGYRIGDGWLEPDVSISWPDQQRDDKYFRRAPMLAVEILSPGDKADRKIELYLEHGAAEVWVINRKERAVTVFTKQAGEIIRIPVEGEYRSAAAQLTVSLAEIFPG